MGKMVVFVIGFWSICIVLGGFMHLLELDNPSFDNMFKSIYWAVVTLTTVGYGDSVPESSGGQVLAAVTMTLGYTLVVLGLRNQIPIPSILHDRNRNSSDLDSDGAAGGGGPQNYITMNSDVRLENHRDDFAGVELQAHQTVSVGSSGGGSGSGGGSLRKGSSMRQMISFPENDKALSMSLVPSLAPTGAEYRHRSDDDTGENFDDSENVAAMRNNLAESKHDNDDDDDENLDEVVYRRTYDHSL